MQFTHELIAGFGGAFAIERTCSGRLRLPPHAADVKR
jgi:hypothetical protein